MSPPQAVSPQTAPRQDGPDARKHAARLFHSLADPTRLAILHALQGGEMRVTDLVAQLGTSQANASWHLSCLKDCGLVADRTQGRANYYRLARPELAGLLHATEQLLSATGQQVTLLPAKAVGARDPRWYPPTGQHSAGWDQPRSWQHSTRADQPPAQEQQAPQDKPVPRAAARAGRGAVPFLTGHRQSRAGFIATRSCDSVRGVTAPGTARPGGRTARTAAAVYSATIDELTARSYDDISIESIAGRAGVHKTTVYRRWHSKAELVPRALADTAGSAIEVPDTGSIDSDLAALARSVRATLSSPRGAAITRTVLAGAMASAEIRNLMQQFLATRLQAISVVVLRAVRRGEIPAGTGEAPLMHAMAAPLYYRLLVTGEPLTDEHADTSAAAALAAARAGVFATAAR